MPETRTRTYESDLDPNDFDNYADYAAAGGDLPPDRFFEARGGEREAESGAVNVTKGDRERMEAGADPATNPMEEITDFLRERFDLTDQEIDRLVNEVGPAYGTAAIESSTAVDDLLGDYNETVDPLLGATDIPDYVGDMEGTAQDAAADPYFVESQKQVLEELMGLTTPEMTAKERAMQEASRQAREGEFRSQREAILSDARRRGVGGGGAEMAAVLGSGQSMANQRLLDDLTAQGSAVDRAMAALEGAGNVSAQGRQQSFYEDFATKTAADDVSKFNKGLRSEYDMFVTDAEIRDKIRRGGLAGDKARLGAGAIADKFNYMTEPLRFRERAAGMKTGANTDAAKTIASSMAATEGAKQAEKAAALLADSNNGLFDDDVPILGWL
jgi:hypothetical protein